MRGGPAKTPIHISNDYFRDEKEASKIAGANLQESAHIFYEISFLLVDLGS